jgi:CRP-like cAMP-binding protein
MSIQSIFPLQRVAFLRDLNHAALTDIGAAAHQRQAARNSFFFYQDDPATAFYIVVQGSVRLTKMSAEGQQVILRYARPNDEIGIIAVLDNAVYPLSAQAVSDCVVLMWDSRTLRQLMERYPTLAVHALQMVAERFVELQTQYRELATERVERRLARALLRLVQQAGREVSDGVLLDLPLSRQDLAEMTGTNLYNASRMLRKWEQQGIITSRRECVLIRDPHGLVAIAEDLPPLSPPAGDATSS